MKVITAFTLASFIANVLAYDLRPEIDVPPAIGYQCPIVDGENATLMKHPADCSIYYHCDMGIPVKMYCPYGLHFNNCAKVCDWRYRACCDPIYDLKHLCRTCE